MELNNPHAAIYELTNLPPNNQFPDRAVHRRCLDHLAASQKKASISHQNATLPILTLLYLS